MNITAPYRNSSRSQAAIKAVRYKAIMLSKFLQLRASLHVFLPTPAELTPFGCFILKSEAKRVCLPTCSGCFTSLFRTASHRYSMIISQKKKREKRKPFLQVKGRSKTRARSLSGAFMYPCFARTGTYFC